MALIDFISGTGKLNGDDNGASWAKLVDDEGNSISNVQLDTIPSSQGALLVAGKNDQYSTIIRTDRLGNQMIGNYIPELIESFEGATVNVQKWTPASTTFVPAQTTLAGYIFNSTNLTTVSAVSILQSQRLFYKYVRMPLQFKQRYRHSMVSGTIADFGWGVPATTTLVVPNGTCFRFTNSGAIQGVITYNSVEIAVGTIKSKVNSNGNTIDTPLNMSNSYYTSNYFVYDIILDDDDIIFTIQDTQTGEMIGSLTLSVPVGYQKMWGATALPVYSRVFNNTSPSTSPVNIITELQVLSLDMGIKGDYSQIAGNLGMSAGRNPFTGAQLENHTNSTAPVSATLSNTAAGYTTLGGKWQFVAVAGAITDYALFGFTVPAGSKFICEGVKIDSYNTVVATATTATVLEWSAGFNSSAVSLATANIVRIQLGVQTFPVGAAVGAMANTIDINFTTPEVVESGRFLHIILNVPIGTATATEIFRGIVTIKGRFM